MDNTPLDIISGQGGSCFTADTLILTPKGLVRIDSIKAGDEVISFDDTGSLHTGKVLSTNAHSNREVSRYYIWGAGYIDATPNHWVLTADNSFIEIGKVNESISLVDASGFLRPIKNSEVLEVSTVYNFIVEGYHTYIANGLRVHNGGGSKGSSSSPTEASDTLHSKTYAKVLDLLCEGEIEGLVNGGQSIYFNATPLMNSDNSFNYKDVEWHFRPGTQNQDPIDGFDEVEAEIADTVELTKAIPKVISITDPTVDKVRLSLSIPALYEQEADGDIVGSSLAYRIYLQKNGNTGTGATASVGTIDNGVIYRVPITNGGSGYSTSGTTISISGAGTSATVTPVVTTGIVKTITVNDGGSNYSNATARVVGTGTGAELSVTLTAGYDEYNTGYVSAIKVINGGTGYTTASIIIEGDGTGAKATANIVNGVITAVLIPNGGKNYTTATSFTAVGAGSGATFGTPTIANGVIKTITLGTPGTGYASPYLIISDLNNIANGASATATVNTAGAITSISVTKGGSGYTTENTRISVASGGFSPITLTDIPSIITYNKYDTALNIAYTANCQKTKGMLALTRPYSVWNATTKTWNLGYSSTSKVAQFKIRYRVVKDTAETFSLFGSGDEVYTYVDLQLGELSFGQTNQFFALEAVLTPYNTLKASNPTITLTYSDYIRNRLRILSPNAPQEIIDSSLIIAKEKGWIFPVPYLNYDLSMLYNYPYEFQVVTKGQDQTDYTISGRVGFYGSTASYDSILSTITGKTTSKYTINHTITLPRTSDSDRFDIKVERVTDDSLSSTLQNKLYFESYATIVAANLRYPNSALFGIKINSDNFSSIPTRGYHLKLLKIQIPDNYDPITGLYNRLNTTIPAITNLALYSEELDNSTWNANKVGINVTANAVVSPNRTLTADKLVETATTDYHRIGQNFTSGTAKRASFYARSAERTAIRAWSFTGGDVSQQDFNLTSGTCSGSLSPSMTKVTVDGVDWWRCSFNVPSAHSSISIGPSNGSVSGTNTYLGTAGSGVYIWGVQLETGSSTSDYVSTYNTTVTRASLAPGVLRYDVAGNPIEQLWTGNFYTAWSNNPAWCFYDLVTNARYGLGEYVTPDLVDEYTLYSIGKYCDTLVPDGMGGTERRFTLNTYLQTREDAIKVLLNLASTFRGMVYWNSGLLSATQDAQGSTPVLQFNNSNVIDGVFNYSGASRKAIHNAALVTWNDPQLQFRQRVEYVEDRLDIDRYGYNPSDIVAFGCTSRGQAHRVGKALLYTEKVENNIIAFKAALEAAYLRPGLLIKVMDEVRSGAAADGSSVLAGRVISKTSNSVTLDRQIYLNGTAHKIRLNTINLTPDPDKGFMDALKTVEYTVTNAQGYTTVINTAETISDTIVGPNSIWTLSNAVLQEELYKVLAIKETDELGIYEIAGMLHNPSKYDYIENNLDLQAYSYSSLNALPATPTFSTPVANPDYPATSNVPYIRAPLMSGIYISSSGIIDSYLNISFEQAQYAVRYDIYLKKDSDDWQKVVSNTTRTSYTQYSTKDGSYYRVKVIAKNFLEQESGEAIYPPLTESAYLALGKLAEPTNVTGLTAVASKEEIKLSWNPITDLDIDSYEIRKGTSSATWSTATTIQLIKATNITLPPDLAGSYKYFIKALDTSGKYSVTADDEPLTITAPSQPSITPTPPPVEGNTIKLSWTSSEQTFSIKKYYIYRDSTNILTVPGNTLSVNIPINWTSSTSLQVRAEDIAGNTSTISASYALNLVVPSITNVVTQPIVAAEAILDLTVTNGDLPLSHIETRYDAASWEAAGTDGYVLGTTKSNLVVAPINWPTTALVAPSTATRVFRFKAYNTAGMPSTEYTKNITVSAPATPSINTPVYEQLDNTVRLSWQNCQTTLPIDYYEVREGSSWATATVITKVYALEATLPVTWSTSSNYLVKAYDIRGNESIVGTRSVSAATWGAISFKNPSYTLVDSNCILAWNTPTQTGSFSLDHYNIYDTSTTSAVLGSTTTEFFSLPITWTGNKTFYVEPVDSKNNKGTASGTTVTVSLPVAPTIDTAGCGFLLDQYNIKWNAVTHSTSTIAIEEYEVGYYTGTAQVAVSLGRVKGTVFSNKVDWGDVRNFWVKSIDILGNVGTAVSTTSLEVITPGAISTSDMQVQVVDNNVLLYWGAPTATLPILTYEIREGTSWSPPDRIIGTKTGNFTTIFETTSGNFTYWIAAIDTAGNYGIPVSVSTTVNQPPDYVLKDDFYTDFTANTKSGAFIDIDGSLVMPVNTTETWTTHFTDKNWTTPQDQITDGFSYFIEPGIAESYYEETKNYGAVLAANKISITPTKAVIVGNPSIICDIYTSLDNTNWTPSTNSWSTYATNFQYMKYRVTVSGAKAATYTQSSTTATVSCAAHGLITSDSIYLNFTSGGGANVYDNSYTVNSVVDSDTFKVIVATTGSATGNVEVYCKDKFSGIVDFNKINIRLDSKLKTINGNLPVKAPITSVAYSQTSYTMTLTKTAHGILANAVVDLDYGLTGATYNQTGTSIVVTKTAHGFLATEKVILNFTPSSGIARNDYFTISSAAANTFTVTSSLSASTSGTVTITQPFKVASITADTITITNVVSKSISGTTSIDSKGTCVFMTSDRTINTTREYIDVDAISITPNTTTAAIGVYDFADVPNPWYFRILLFNTSGTQISGTCSYTIRGF